MNVANRSFKSSGYLWLAGTTFVCLLLGYVFYDFIFVQQLAQKEELSNQLQLEKTRVAVLEHFAAEHPDQDSYLQELDLEIVRVNKLLPDKANMGETVAFIENTAKNTKVVFGALTTEKSVYANGWTEARLVFKVLGAYSDLLEFTKQLDNGPRFMAVRAVEFKDRITLNPVLKDQSAVLKLLEQELSSKGNILVKPVIERGLLTKQNLIIMNVYLMVATQGRLPGADNAPPPKAAEVPPPTPTPAKS